MSFVRALATLAVGFAAAKGVRQFQKIGGVDKMTDAMRDAGKPGGMADQMGEMAEKFGFPGGREAVREMMSRFGSSAAQATEATEAGIGSLVAAMSGAASAGAKSMTDMMSVLTKGTPVNAIMEENAKLMIRAMIQAAKADGEIDGEERAKIMEHLKDASPEEIAFIETEMAAPVDVTALAKAAGEAAKAQVYSAALMAISVDSEPERQYLANLAAALALETSKVREIHTAMNKPLM